MYRILFIIVITVDSMMMKSTMISNDIRIWHFEST